MEEKGRKQDWSEGEVELRCSFDGSAARMTGNSEGSEVS